MPFAGYETFDDCVSDNQDKDDPEAFCAWLEKEREVNMSKIERRYIPASLGIEERADGKAPVLKGLIPYNSQSEDLGGFREIFRPGSFSDTIRQDDVVGLFNHEPSLVLGRSSAGTLRFQDGDAGLIYVLEPPDTQVGRDLVTSVKRGDIKGTSFAFFVMDMTDEVWEKNGDMPIRNILRAKLSDVSPCTFPAYPESQVALRSLENWKASQEPVQRQLRARRQRLTELTVDS